MRSSIYRMLFPFHSKKIVSLHLSTIFAQIQIVAIHPIPSQLLFPRTLLSRHELIKHWFHQNYVQNLHLSLKLMPKPRRVVCCTWRRYNHHNYYCVVKFATRRRRCNHSHYSHVNVAVIVMNQIIFASYNLL